MRVISVANCMGGVGKTATLQSWVGRLKLWGMLHDNGHAQLNFAESKTYGAFLLSVLVHDHSVFDAPEEESLDVFVPASRLVDGQHRLIGAYVLAQEKAHSAFDRYDELLRSIDHFLDLAIFAAAYKAVTEALNASVVALPHALVSIRDTIKSLNLPKNLFPQSLRPIESIAR